MNQTSKKQIFIIFRHGARYPILKPKHNVLWPPENYYWDQHLGKLSPVGVLQLCNLGLYFKSLYPWVNDSNVIVHSTKKSRAIESAWSFLLGLLPETPIKIKAINNNNNNQCTDSVCCRSGMVCIKYYPNNDPIFGRYDPSHPHIDNILASTSLNHLCNNQQVINLLNRLTKAGYFKSNKKLISSVAKLKNIYAQMQVDGQLGVPHHISLIGKYNLSPEEINIINHIGLEVICRRSVPASDLLDEDVYNGSQGYGLVSYIKDHMESYNFNDNEFHILSCHDSNIIAFGSVLGLKIPSPDFSGYILIERDIEQKDIVKVFYCKSPFNDKCVAEAKFWTGHNQRDYFLNWYDLPSGIFDTSQFLDLFNHLNFS